MDPITALGLAASIVQFVEFRSRILSDGVEIYRNGLKLEMRELETINDDLLQITSGIKLGTQFYICHSSVHLHRSGICT